MPLARPQKRWTHEEASEMMLEYLIDDNYIDIDRHQINFVKDLIAGVPKSTRYVHSVLHVSAMIAP